MTNESREETIQKYFTQGYSYEEIRKILAKNGYQTSYRHLQKIIRKMGSNIQEDL